MTEEEQRRQQIQERQAETGEHRQALALPRLRLLGRRFAQLVKTEQQRAAEQQRAQRHAADQTGFCATQLAEKYQRRPQLQQQRKSPGYRSLLTQAEPADTRAFHRPRGCGPARIEPQRNRQAGEDDAQGQTGFPQQQRSTWHQQSCQAHIDQAQGQGAERGGEFQMLNQGELQPKAHQRRTEQQRAVNVVTLARRPEQQRFTAVILGRVAH
ncbi:hypothetical protein D3C76_817810 [compost metagenome]